MKKVILLVLLASSSAFAGNSQIGSSRMLTRDSVELLEAAIQCGSMLKELSAQPYIDSAEVETRDEQSVYKIRFATGGYAPLFDKEYVAMAVITKSFKASHNIAPDAPGGEQVFDCTFRTK